MNDHGLMFVCCSDVAGKVRGKAFPAEQFEWRLKRGVGWTPTNVQITCFDTIAESPFGSFGDLLLIPDAGTRVEVDFDDTLPPEQFVIGDILHTDGSPWECCTRAILRHALHRLQECAGLNLLSAFEHEFHFTDMCSPTGSAYSYAGFRAKRVFGETLMRALDDAGLGPDTFMHEYGRDQYEVTIAPRQGIDSADQAVILRELTRITAERTGSRVSFTPSRDPAGVGNGVHIHMSFIDDTGTPFTYDPTSPTGLSAVAGSFVAGVLRYLDAIIAITAPSQVSYARLTPHRWSAAFNNLGIRDREAAVRVCPLSDLSDIDKAAQFNFEFRAADAAASPYLQLAAIVHAGVQGIVAELPSPAGTEEDLSALTEDNLTERGFARLPTTLAEALQRLEENAEVRDWFPQGFIDVYLQHKRGELACLEDKSEAEIAAAYEDAY